MNRSMEENARSVGDGLLVKQRGVTSIEYALISALIALAIIGGVSATGAENAFNWSSWLMLFLDAIGAPP